MVPEIPKWSPDLLQLCSRSVSGCTRGTLGPSFGIRTWFRVPSWAPRTTLGAKFGVENLCFRYPPVNFRRKNKPKAIRFTMFRFSMSLVRRIVRGISSHVVNKFLFFFGVGGSGRSPLESADSEGPASGEDRRDLT